MHDVSPATLELTGMLWLQPEQRCQAWELWDRIAKTASGQQVTPIAWSTPPSSGSASPTDAVELNVVSPELPVPPVVPIIHKRNPHMMKRSPEWNLSMVRYGGTPWKAPNKVYEYSVNGLTEEIEDFFEFIQPKEDDETVREIVIDRIRKVVLKRWPDAEVNVFGSFCSGLYLPTSDIDIIVKGCWGGIPPLYDLERELIKAGVANPASIKVLDKATVPLIKFQDALTNVKVDVAFNQVNCIDSARFVTRCCELFPCLKKLAFVFKQFISGLHLNEVFHGGLSSYSLILMILSYLQRYPDRAVVRDPNVSTGLLLMDILLYYGNRFDYDTYGIRIRGGGSLVEKSELRESMASYNSGTDTAAANNGTGMLSIEDPLAPGNDVARSSFSFSRIRDAFQAAFCTLEPVVHPIFSRPLSETSPGESLLGRIIRIPDAVVDNRISAAAKIAALLASDAFYANKESSRSGSATLSTAQGHERLNQREETSQCWKKHPDRNHPYGQAPQSTLGGMVAAFSNGGQNRRNSGGGGGTDQGLRSSDGEGSSRASSPVSDEVRKRPRSSSIRTS